MNFNDAGATARSIRDGWFHSGDMAVVHPDGFVEIRDRLKDVIISGGENISSVEVECALLEHAAVREATVVGMPDPRYRIALGPQRSQGVYVAKSPDRSLVSGRESRWRRWPVSRCTPRRRRGPSAQSIGTTLPLHYPSARGVERLSLTPQGNIRYALKTPYRDGTTHVIFEPLDFLARLASLVPSPRVNLTRFHGCLLPTIDCARRSCGGNAAAVPGNLKQRGRRRRAMSP
jgi:acyl-CoA synthetase (AMP-forming)/AMP-acid ligase II